MEKKDFYEILGLKKGAEESEIKTTFRRLAKQYHPDQTGGDPAKENIYSEITEAYEVLSDHEKKRLYDTYGMRAYEADWDEEKLKHQKAGSSVDSAFYGAMDFETWFEQKTRSRKQAQDRDNKQRGQERQTTSAANRNSEVSISFEESVSGCTKYVSVSGKRYEVKIPAGIDEGQRVRVKRNDGDLLVTIHIAGSNIFRREGIHVYSEEAVLYTTAVLGGEIRVRTLYGMKTLKIPAGTPSGKVFTLRAMGFPSLKEKGMVGDAFIKIEITVPTVLSEKERSCMEALVKAEEEAGKR
mgnify:CR=1 FL=1